MSDPIDFCPNCDVAATLVRERRMVPLGSRRVEIDDEFLRCEECDEEFYSPELADQRQRRAIERARSEDNLLSPSQIKAIREGLGLSQRLFEQILGVGEKTCIRWEQGRVCQNVATDRLMRLVAADRENVQRLAVINGVLLPDSCFIPKQEVSAPTYAGALAAWERETNAIDPGRSITLAGTPERDISDTAEHKAIIAASTTPIAIHPLKQSVGLGQSSRSRRGGVLQ